MGEAGPRGPRRVLVLSAPVGEGHVAAARALASRMRERWPDAQIDEVEDAAGGPLRTRALITAYRLVMRAAPGLYGTAYDVLGRLPAVARLFQRLGAPGTARAVQPMLARHDPDLVVSTYPVTTGGLARLRRTGRLRARVVAVVTDPAVHPFWVWPGVDETWSMLPSTAERARALVPGAEVRVVPPAVDPQFGPAGPPSGPFTVLVTGGSLGFGDLGAVVDAVRAAGARAVVLCGRNERLRARLAGRDGVRAEGWTDAVPAEMAASHVVLTTGGGMLAMEALAVGRPVLFATPVPGHGRAGAASLAAAGLAVVAETTADVSAVVARLRDDPGELAALTERAREFAAAAVEPALDALAARIGSWPRGRAGGGGSGTGRAGVGGS